LLHIHSHWLEAKYKIILHIIIYNGKPVRKVVSISKLL
jgi:hypothetical protein